MPQALRKLRADNPSQTRSIQPRKKSLHSRSKSTKPPRVLSRKLEIEVVEGLPEHLKNRSSRAVPANSFVTRVPFNALRNAQATAVPHAAAGDFQLLKGEE